MDSRDREVHGRAAGIAAGQDSTRQQPHLRMGRGQECGGGSENCKTAHGERVLVNGSILPRHSGHGIEPNLQPGLYHPKLSDGRRFRQHPARLVHHTHRSMTESAAALHSPDTLSAIDFAPTGWLANAHFQSIIPSLSLRRPLLARRARQLLDASDTQIVDCGDGVRLLGHYSSQVAAGNAPAREVVILLHGWEGSAESIYVLSLGSHLFSLGYDIFRLNFRDHGPSHHLNEEIFH